MKLPMTITTKTGNTCTLNLEGDNYIMRGATGSHRLSTHCTDANRLQAHWNGFVDNNGGFDDNTEEQEIEELNLCDIEEIENGTKKLESGQLVKIAHLSVLSIYVGRLLSTGCVWFLHTDRAKDGDFDLLLSNLTAKNKKYESTKKQTGYEAGDHLDLYRNQNFREAVILAILSDRALVEYEMPNGTSALNFVNLNGKWDHDYRPISYFALPKKWAKAMLEQQGSEAGFYYANPQRSHSKCPTIQEILTQ